jgi:hypothetical protein
MTSSQLDAFIVSDDISLDQYEHAQKRLRTVNA